ncbi:MAG TPA: VTT domain-containing protein [Candidatus Limnocylindrales bacterium]|nr:VTT domain-containing protein [Candidatus Limnocylindrales bacterium]
MAELIRLLTHPKDLILAFGPLAYVGLFSILFAETGLFVGFFLPGDSLLFAAGVLAAAGALDLVVTCLVCTAGAISGNLVGFAFGRRVGRPLFERPDSRFFKRQHLLAAEAFYARHGGKTIVLARFLPFIRTFAPIVAGASRMETGRFVLYTVVGGVLWGTGLPVAGYFVGNLIPDIDKVLLPIIVVIVLVSVLPTALHLARANRERIPGLRRRLDPGEGG